MGCCGGGAVKGAGVAPQRGAAAGHGSASAAEDGKGGKREVRFDRSKPDGKGARTDTSQQEPARVFESGDMRFVVKKVAEKFGSRKGETFLDTIGDYDVDMLLGRGSYGTVHAARHSRGGGDGRMYALKMFDKRKLSQRQIDAHVWTEVRMLADCKGHDGVIFLQDVLESDNRVHMVVEWVRGPDLQQVIKKEAPLVENRAKLFLKSLIEALRHCHGCDVIHRDVKPENLLVSSEMPWMAKLSDFGLSGKQLSRDHLFHEPCGTPQYVAPEIITKHKEGYIGPPVDVWSSGAVLYEMLTGNLPFQCQDRSKKRTRERLEIVYSQIKRAQYPKERLARVHASEDATELLQQFFSVNPAQRITCDGILESAWLSPEKLGQPRRRHGPMLRSAPQQQQHLSNLLSAELGYERDLEQEKSAVADGRVGRYMLGVPLGRDHLGALHACSTAQEVIEGRGRTSEGRLPCLGSPGNSPKQGSINFRDPASSVNSRGSPKHMSQSVTLSQSQQKSLAATVAPTVHVAHSANPYAIRCLDAVVTNALGLLENEVDVLTRVECDNVVKVWDNFAYAGNIYTVMDLIIGTSLQHMVSTEEVCRRSFRRMLGDYVHQLVRTVAFLHQEGVAHNALSLDAVMLDSALGRMVVCDFSRATLGTPAWSNYGRCHGPPRAFDACGDVLELGVDWDTPDDLARIAYAEQERGFVVSPDGRRARIVEWAAEPGDAPRPLPKAAAEAGWALHLLSGGADEPERSMTDADLSRRQGPFDECPNAPAYRPPELAQGGQYYGEEADCWALGVILYRLVEPGAEPFASSPPGTPPGSPVGSPSGGRRRFDRGDNYTQPHAGGGAAPAAAHAARGGAKLLFSRRVQEQEPDLRDLIAALLQPDPARRLTARRALQHRYFSTRQLSAEVPRSPRGSPRKLTLSVDSLGAIAQMAATPSESVIGKQRSGAGMTSASRNSHPPFPPPELQLQARPLNASVEGSVRGEK